jgi:hypothetical protein
MAKPFTPVATRALSAVTGGAAVDSSKSVLGGLGYNSNYKKRDDSTYRLDSIKSACDQANTHWFWGLDQQKAGQCVLDHLDPPAPKSAQ